MNDAIRRDLVGQSRERFGGTGWQKPLSLRDALLIQRLEDALDPDFGDKPERLRAPMTAPDLSALCADLRAKAEAATPGEWQNERASVGVVGTDWGVGYPSSAGTIASLDDGEYIENRNAEADAAFIAAANPAVVLRLVAALEAQAKALNGIKRACDETSDAFGDEAEPGVYVKTLRRLMRSALADGGPRFPLEDGCSCPWVIDGLGGRHRLHLAASCERRVAASPETEGRK